LADNLALCWPWLARANPEVRRDHLAQLLTAQQAQLWPGEGGALVTQLITLPEGKFVHVWLGGGRMRSLLDMRAGVEAWGRQQGCDFASINGRKGWDRVFEPFGYTRMGDELVKELA